MTTGAGRVEMGVSMITLNRALIVTTGVCVCVLVLYVCVCMHMCVDVEHDPTSRWLIL